MNPSHVRYARSEQRPQVIPPPPKRADVFPWWVWAATPAGVIVLVAALVLIH